jgi:CHAT domain-containing protein
VGKILLIFSLIIVTLQSCTTIPSIPSEKVQQETSSMAKEESLVPPPRRIDDITDILNQAGKFNANITASFKRKADAEPPANESKQGLADFYKKRGLAAWELGRYKQTLNDFEMAQNYAEEAGISDPEFIHRLAIAEMEAGNFNRAIQLSEQSVKISSFNWSYRLLSSAYALIGDVEAANKIKQEAINNCQGTGKKRRGTGRRKGWGANQCALQRAYIEASILEAQGKYKEAEAYIRQVLDRRLYLGDDASTPESVLRYKARLARNLYHQGRFFDSEIAARDLLNESLGLGGQESAQTFSAISIISQNLAAQGRTQEAERLLSLAIKVLEASGVTDDSKMGGQVRSNYGALLAAKGNFKDALEQFDLVRTGLQENQYLYENLFAKNPSLLLSLIMTGRIQEAMDFITKNYEKFEKVLGEKNFHTAEMLALRGMAYFRMNNIKQALEDFSRSIDVLTQYATERGGYLRNQRVKTIIHDYMRLLDQIRGTQIEKDLSLDAVAISFRLSEATRSQTVQSALLASSAREAETDPDVINLIRQEQDTSQQINAIEASILAIISAPSDQQNPQLIKNLRLKLDTLRLAKSTLLDEIKKRSKKYAAFVNPQPPFPSAVQRYLHHGESLISIYSLDDHTYIWAIPQNGQVQFASSPIRKKDLEELVSVLQGSLVPTRLAINDLPAFDLGRSYELYKQLLLPVWEGWKDAHDLLVIVNEPVNQIPLSVLITAPFKGSKDEKLLFEGYKKVPWLIGQFSITMVPSASSLISLRILPAGTIQRKAFAGFGDPIFRPEQLGPGEKPQEIAVAVANQGDKPIQVRGIRVTTQGDLDGKRLSSCRLERLNRLPDTAEEIKTIATTVGADLSRDVFLGKQASERQVRTMNLADRQIIAFATHGLVPGDLDGLDQPALALSSPSVTNEPEDGLLTMEKIMKLKLNADWVVLSACNTAAANGAGAEALSGLGRAFFYAGTRSVLASMYPVETTSARKLVTATFKYQKEEPVISRARALQKSMLDVMTGPGLVDPETGEVACSYAHPLFWAPFILVGDPGARLQ